MGNMKDMAGQIFGRLTVLSMEGKSKRGHYLWRCKCECGNQVVVNGASLRTGNTKSCGCLHLEKAIERIQHLNESHGMANTRLFKIWYGIIVRCQKPYAKNYHHYGARGINICPDWDDFSTFRDWSLKNGYTDELTIDRIDVNGNYEPSNCRWITNNEQQRNKRTNLNLTYNGETKCVTEWGRQYGLRPETISDRIRKLKWDVGKAITTPARQFKHS